MKPLETEHLILRDWTQDDLDDLYEILSDPRIAIPAGNTPVTSKEKCLEVLQYMIRMKNNYAMELKDGGKIIGSIGINEDVKRQKNTRNLGFSVAVAYQNKGYLQEALVAVIANAKEHIDYLSATHLEDNTKSAHILRKFGFEQVDVLSDIQRGADKMPHTEPYYLRKL